MITYQRTMSTYLVFSNCTTSNWVFRPYDVLKFEVQSYPKLPKQIILGVAWRVKHTFAPPLVKAPPALRSFHNLIPLNGSVLFLQRWQLVTWWWHKCSVSTCLKSCWTFALQGRFMIQWIPKVVLGVKETPQWLCDRASTPLNKILATVLQQHSHLISVTRFHPFL